MKFTSFAQLLLSAAVLTKTVSAGKNGNSIHEAPVETHNADGQACKVKYNDNNSRYFKVNGHECPTGYTCVVDNDDGTAGEIDGVCETENCAGKADPDTVDDTGTTRVTICHRTCSETNPWVRITIDDDAWGGENASGCGHQLEHDVEVDCANKAPWTAWGANRKDYLIKWHGTRAEVLAENGWTHNSNEEKNYWKYWERACPYVRQDKCCDWASGSCCGDAPTEAPSPAPSQITDAPTPSPSAGPSASPTASPTEAHSSSPSAHNIPEEPECPSGESVVTLVGINHLPADDYFGSDTLPVVVTSMQGTNADGRKTVDFSVCPSLIQDEATSLFTYYGNPDKECVESPLTGPCVDYTAVCTENPDTSYAIVNVFVGSTAGANDILPLCCGDDQQVMEYTFMVLCECPPMSTA